VKSGVPSNAAVAPAGKLSNKSSGFKLPHVVTSTHAFAVTDGTNTTSNSSNNFLIVSFPGAQSALKPCSA
ncbi:hypothetical protein J6T66_02630, partial [bacterium]|nr:hypothetical protein [bacterium]